MADKFSCNECGKEFDSERGLHIHEGQVHDVEPEKNTEKEENTSGSESDVEEIGKEHDSSNEEGKFPLDARNIQVSVEIALLSVFVFGVAVGLSSGLLMSGGSFDTPQMESPGNGDSGSTAVVSLSTTEYPYQGIEAGVGEGNITIGNSTYHVDGEPYFGSPDAPVKLVSYEDFECPFCGRYHENTFGQVKDNYVKTGDVQYFFKNFPLNNIHPWASQAAVAGECALNQGAKKFWIFENGFFANQDALNTAYKNDKFDASMYKWAEQAGLDVDQFKQCYNNKEEQQEVQQDQQEGIDQGVSGTPTFFINGQKLVGAQPFGRFQAVISAELAE